MSRYVASFYALSAFLLSLFASSSFAATVGERYEEILDLHQSGRYDQSIPLIEEMCAKDRYMAACLMLGGVYARGEGVKKNKFKALEILIQNESLHDAFKVSRALLLERDFEEDESLEMAMEIYAAYVDSETDFVADEARKGLGRKPIYDLLAKYIPLQNSFDRGSLDYASFHDAFYELYPSQLPPELDNGFRAMRDACVKVSRMKDQGVEDFDDPENLQALLTCKSDWETFWDTVKKSGASVGWINRKIKE